MKRREFLSTSVFFGSALFLPSAAHATAPSLVDPTYNAASKILSVKIRHFSLFDSWHYIKTVDVKVNGTLAFTKEYTSQPGNEYTYNYDLDAKPGDTIEVTAKCSWWGSRTTAITLTPGGQTPAAVDATKPDK